MHNNGNPDTRADRAAENLLATRVTALEWRVDALEAGSEGMDYKAAWDALRADLYRKVKGAVYTETRYFEAVLDMLSWMIDAEDKAAGFNIDERHTHELHRVDVIALYEARER